jgi:hypothetical protein
VGGVPILQSQLTAHLHFSQHGAVLSQVLSMLGTNPKPSPDFYPQCLVQAHYGQNPRWQQLVGSVGRLHERWNLLERGVQRLSSLYKQSQSLLAPATAMLPLAAHLANRLVLAQHQCVVATGHPMSPCLLELILCP